MPIKKKEIIPEKPTASLSINEKSEDDDNKSVSTDSDIVSGTFSQLDNEDAAPELNEEENVDSDVDSIELEAEVEEE